MVLAIFPDYYILDPPIDFELTWGRHRIQRVICCFFVTRWLDSALSSMAWFPKMCRHRKLSLLSLGSRETCNWIKQHQQQQKHVWILSLLAHAMFSLHQNSFTDNKVTQNINGHLTEKSGKKRVQKGESHPLTFGSHYDGLRDGNWKKCGTSRRHGGRFYHIKKVLERPFFSCLGNFEFRLLFLKRI